MLQLLAIELLSISCFLLVISTILLLIRIKEAKNENKQ